MMIEIGIGEFIDRMSILEIKMENGLDVQKEYTQYTDKDICHEDGFGEYLSVMTAINETLWNLEDKKRKGVERYSDTESDVAFLITQLNDLRHETKKRIDVFFSSNITERKSH